MLGNVLNRCGLSTITVASKPSCSDSEPREIELAPEEKRSSGSGAGASVCLHMGLWFCLWFFLGLHCQSMRALHFGFCLWFFQVSTTNPLPSSTTDCACRHVALDTVLKLWRVWCRVEGICSMLCVVHTCVVVSFFKADLNSMWRPR